VTDEGSHPNPALFERCERLNQPMQEIRENVPRKDKTGEPYEVGLCGEDMYRSLMRMYEVFLPRPASQGLPPANPEVCEKWVKELLSAGENVVARRGDEIVGHASLIPDTRGEAAEFVIFVHQAYRNRGIGTELTEAAIKRAKEVGFKSVWLTVSITNSLAIKLYRKLGFQYCDMDDCERIMVIGF
jgi:diamine N-acetyltransferase